MRFIAATAFIGLMLLASAAPAGDAVEQVEIRDFAFHPAQITIKAGSTVRWTNREKRQYHSVWFQEAGDPEPDYIFPDEYYERSFDEPGVFNYRCGPHEYMKGTVTVTE